MAETTRTALKAFFETNDKPTQSQFADLIDSFQNILDDGAEYTFTPILPADDVVIAQGVLGVPIGNKWAGKNLKNAIAVVFTKGITGKTDVMIRRVRAGVAADMLSAPVSLADVWYAQNGTIDLTNDDLLLGDWIFADVDDAHSGTKAKGLGIILKIA